MKNMKRAAALTLTVVLALSALCTGASAKTNPAGQTVGTVLFYVRNSAGEDILVSQIPVSEMEADMQAGRIDTTLHNYSVLDRYVTTVHQEAQGFTAPDFVAYAQSKSTLDSLKSLTLTFAGNDKLAFWEIDQTGYDDADTYTYDDLYGVERYNFPLLYEYWDYRTQDYYDPAGEMTRDEVIDHIFANGEPEIVLLSVRAFSQRYMVDEKYGTGDYNMESLWSGSGLLDNERTIRLLIPMTEEELYSKTPTASNTRYWNANILLDMERAPDVASLGEVAAPTATMTEDADTYYITFDCATEGAAILYNHNYISPSYTPSCEYTGGAVEIPKSWFPAGTVTMTCRAVKEGCTDAGVQTLTLTASGTGVGKQNAYSDVAEGAWYYDCVQYVTEKDLFDAVGADAFGPEAPMTRAMLATALYRLAGEPKAAGITSTPFTDVAPSAEYADAVAWAYQAGIVSGTNDGTTYSPDATITREEIVTMFYRYAANVAQADMSASDGLAAFTDAGSVAGWALKQMQWCVATGLITGTGDGTALTPQGTTQRAEAAALVMRLAEYMGQGG